MKKIVLVLLILSQMALSGCHSLTGSCKKENNIYGTAALMVIVERESESIVVVNTVDHKVVGRVEGLGNLRHASMVFSRDGRYAYPIGRDGTLTKIDLIKLKIEKQVKVGENSIGIAISRDGRYIMVCNYQPGSVVIVEADSLEKVKEIPAVRQLEDGTTITSRTVGPLDTADNLMIFGLMETGGVWVVDMKQPDFPVIKKYWDVGDTPYDQLITPDGRHYMVGFLGSDWMGLLDTWKLGEMKRIDVSEKKKGIKAKEGEKVPVYHIPHLESWAISGDLALVPAFGEKRVIVYNRRNWELVKSIAIEGTGLFVVARPGGRHVWVDNVAAPGSREERLMQVVDMETLEIIKSIDAGKGAINPQFTPKGDAVYLSVMGENKVSVYDADSFEVIAEIPAKKPSGIFCTDRTSKFGL